jgi:hypothetical protein
MGNLKSFKETSLRQRLKKGGVIMPQAGCNAGSMVVSFDNRPPSEPRMNPKERVIDDEMTPEQINILVATEVPESRKPVYVPVVKQFSFTPIRKKEYEPMPMVALISTHRHYANVLADLCISQFDKGRLNDMSNLGAEPLPGDKIQRENAERKERLLAEYTQRIVGKVGSYHGTDPEEFGKILEGIRRSYAEFADNQSIRKPSALMYKGVRLKSARALD